MEYMVKSGSPEKQRVGCVLVGVFQQRKLSHMAEELDRSSEGYLSTILRSGDMTGQAEQNLLLHNVPITSCDRVQLVGRGRVLVMDVQ